jgi:GGDEF domain-containing protein
MRLKSGGRWLRQAALLLVALCAATAMARTVLELDPGKQPVSLQDWGDAWVDPTGRALVDDVAARASIPWTPTRPEMVYPLGTGKALWIRFTVPPAPDAERWYLEIPYPSVDLITLYSPDALGQWSPLFAGDSLPVADWPLPHRYPLLPLTVSAEEPRTYLVRIENPHSFSAPLSFVNESYLSRNEQRTSLLLGIYFGLAGLAALLAFVSALWLRDAAYGLYALTVVLMALTQASMTGIAGLHLWPNWPWWNDASSMALPTLTVASVVWFFSAVVSLPERSRGLYRLMQAMAALGVVAAVAVVVAPAGIRFQIMAPYVVGAVAAGVLLVVWAARRGDRHGLGLLAGFVPVIAAATLPLARLWGLIPVSFWTSHAMQIAIAVELPVLLVVLMLRSQQRREHARRVQGLDRIDPATGLINGVVFAQRMKRMMARSHRLKLQGAVLLVDIMNIEQIRRDFDRRSAEELPLLVAGRLLAAAREIDSVARLSEHRFGMLVEGPLNPEDAASAGPRVVARCLMPFPNKPLDWVAQVRVAQALVPSPTAMDADDVLQRLDALLAGVPADTRRAVFNLR